MKKLSNTEVELKKALLTKKKACRKIARALESALFKHA